MQRCRGILEDQSWLGKMMDMTLALHGGGIGPYLQDWMTGYWMEPTELPGPPEGHAPNQRPSLVSGGELQEAQHMSALHHAHSCTFAETWYVIEPSRYPDQLSWNELLSNVSRLSIWMLCMYISCCSHWKVVSHSRSWATLGAASGCFAYQPESWLQMACPQWFLLPSPHNQQGCQHQLHLQPIA